MTGIREIARQDLSEVCLFWNKSVQFWRTSSRPERNKYRKEMIFSNSPYSIHYITSFRDKCYFCPYNSTSTPLRLRPEGRVMECLGSHTPPYGLHYVTSFREKDIATRCVNVVSIKWSSHAPKLFCLMSVIYSNHGETICSAHVMTNDLPDKMDSFGVPTFL